MKKILIILMMIILSVSLVACSGNALESYQVAMEKTDGMVKGAESMEFKVNAKYNVEGLERDVQEKIQSFEDVNFSLKGSFNKELKKSMQMGYLNYGDFGYDFNIYKIGNETYLEPFFLNLEGHRFVKLSGEEFDVSDSEANMELFDKIGAKWNEIINEENVMKGENVLVTTDDGEVKSREFTITLNDSQLKEFLTYIVELFEENEDYLQIMDQVSYTSSEVELTEEEKTKLYKDLFSELKSFLNNSENLSLSYKAYIDIDNYVVQEDIKFSMENDLPKTGELISLEFEMNHKYWNIEKDQELNFQAPSREDSINLEDLNIEELMPQREVK